MMDIFFYQAECGDAARICYVGTDGKPHNIFVDAGYERTFRHALAEEIQTLEIASEQIDLWVVSHIHDDHIGGVLSYIKAIKDGEFTDIVHAWYYNPPRETFSTLSPPSHSISEAKSIQQGDDLLTYLSSVNKVPEVDFTTSLPEINLHGLKITILSPTPEKLEMLREKYPPLQDNPFEREEDLVVSHAVAAVGYDYHIRIDEFDLSQWREDNSVENGSSISFLTEYEGKKVLWLADAHPSVIANSLLRLGYSVDNPLICEWVKVAHHGSKGNNSQLLYSMVRCNNYLMSVNGENRHNLPSKECLARILRQQERPPGSKYHFYFTYDNEILRSIFTVDQREVFERYDFTVTFLKDKRLHVY
ncbi:MBL fold metallo-hydrolase [Cytophagaceae bacterium YF14B1]|uniref:MBL fold metallo-hydrolase n=1 Tax=Xanthocytophaga flava TaxID=3048013 RepID=A0AAE3U981_9BACT|nr:MBL fold metallo-hydrolase [Xanthocytophaga flavus]MDJ1484231.1 MBL fold metallo-hydrolase [Xanthocytophaga flavus]